MITAYLQEALERYTAFGSFAPVPAERLPAPLQQWAPHVLVRREEGLVTAVAFVPLAPDEALRTVRDELAALVRSEAEAHHAVGLGLMLVVVERPVTREQYDQWQKLILNERLVQVVPWVVDLHRRRLYGHEGPPFGIDPDLAMLAAPEPPAARQMEQHRKRRMSPWTVADLARSRATIGLLVVIIGVWVAMTIAGRSLYATEQVDLLITWGALNRPAMFAQGELWRLFTAAFIHIGLAHLAANAIGLLWVGSLTETFYGPWRMLYIFFVSAVASSVLSTMLGEPLALAAGASGAIFGLMGALVWFRFSSPLGRRLPWQPLAVALVVNLLAGLSTAQVDNWGHLGGLVGGVLAAAAVGVPMPDGLPRPRLRLPRRLQAALAAVVLGAACTVLTGWIPIPGYSYDLYRGLQYLEAEQYTEAEPLLERVVARQPDDAQLRWFMFLTYWANNRCTEADAQLTALRALDADMVSDLSLDVLNAQCGHWQQ